MNKKELFVTYINETITKEKKERDVELALRAINPDNTFFGCTTYEYQKVVDNLFIMALGERLFEWAMWYLYDCSLTGPSERTIEVGGKTHLIDSPEKLWDVVGVIEE